MLTERPFGATFQDRRASEGAKHADQRGGEGLMHNVKSVLPQLPTPLRWALLMGLALVVTCCSLTHAAGNAVGLSH